MQTKKETKISLSNLSYLSSYAQYLLSHRLQDYVIEQLNLTKDLKPPLFKFLESMPEDQLLALAKKSSVEFLTYLADNKAQQQIDDSVRNWLANQLPIIDKNEIVAEDITLINYIRKKALHHFITDYCTDIEQIMELVKEIDLYVLQAETASTNTYIKILKDHIEEHSHFIEKINNTTPGATYVFDLERYEGIYSNHKLGDIIGYTQQELNELGNNAIDKLIHPDDRQAIRENLSKILNARDGETASYVYRIRTKQGNYRWVRNYESVFKRHKNGSVWQTIGITLDIDIEKKTSEELHFSDERYKQAEALTHIGNYIWDLSTNEIQWSDELFRIYGLDPKKEAVSFSTIELFNHPEDTANVRKAIKTSIESKQPFDFHYRIILKDGTERTLHARGEFINDRTGKPVKVLGTTQDVTEKQNLIKELRDKESLYKQAEELANMGNWVWDVKNDDLKWTDQLYTIYGLEPQSETITIDKFLSFVHPDDRDYVKEGIVAINKEKYLDYTFRIITKNGKIKTLRSIAQVHTDKNGKPVRVVGTERDTTEKQNLINRLKHSENLYKQAQSLAHVGNWTWDIQSNMLQWSDELYHIYGLEPQSEVISYERYISLIHPEDRKKVIDQIEQSYKNVQSWELVHRILTPAGTTKIIEATGEVLANKDNHPHMMVGTAQDITERQTLIEKLQESENLYKQAQNLAHLGNWTMDMVTNNFTWSEEMYNIYEVANQRFNAEDWKQYIHPEERKSVLEYFKKCIEEKKPYDKVHRIVLPSGRIKTLHRKGEFIYDKNGNVLKMIGTTQDVTEEYRIQQELKDNQTFIRKITDATPSIIASYNINTGKYVFISEGLEKLLGYDTNEVMERGIEFFASIIHPDDAASIMNKNMKALEEANAHPEKGDMVVEFQYRMRNKNGHYRWFHTYGTIFDRNADGKVEHVLNISLDVSEQIEATEKIKEQEHFIQQIADASPTILYLFDVESESIAYINREIFFVLGYLPEEVIETGQKITETLYHPDDYHLLPGRKQSGKNFQQADSMIQYECRMMNKSGEWRWLLVREIVFKTDENGQVKQILGAALDINRRKEMEKTILQNTFLLEQSNASLEEFAYVASHDLKEPLRKISTFGDRLVATQLASLNQEGKIYLQKIVDASQRMQTMISDLLSISMITGNRSFETFSLEKILDETIQTLEFKIEQQNAVVRHDPLPNANIIPSQFRQLFQNLLSNSLKFVREGVQPVIIIKHSYVRSNDIVHYQLTEAVKYHKIEISDNGIGFENEFAGKIFAIFQRLHGRSEYEGSGIGLAICKKIVEHHGGIIYANGVPGQGSTFTVILPA